VINPLDKSNVLLAQDMGIKNLSERVDDIEEAPRKRRRLLFWR